MATETMDEVRQRLRRVGLQVPAVMLATAVTFGSVSTLLPTFASAATTQSQGVQDSPDPAMKKLRDRINQVNDARKRFMWDKLANWVENHPRSGCMAECLLGKWGEQGVPGDHLAPDSIATYLECGAKCMSKKDLRDLKKQSAEWAKEWKADRGVGTRLDTAKKSARTEVNELEAQRKDKSLTPAQRTALDERLKTARSKLAALSEKIDIYKNRKGTAARYEKQGDPTAAKYERDAARIEAQKALKEIEGRTGGKDGTTATGDRRGTGDTGGRGGRGRGGRGGGLSLLSMLIFGGGDEMVGQIRRETDSRNENVRMSVEQLQEYLREHPREADELGPLLHDWKLPINDAEATRQFLRDWDDDHDDYTGNQIQTPCELLGGGGECAPEPSSTKRSPKQIAADRDQAMQAVRDDNKAVSQRTTAEQQVLNARQDAVHEVVRAQNKKGVSQLPTVEEQEIAAQDERVNDVVRGHNKKGVSEIPAVEQQSPEVQQEAAHEVVRAQNKKGVSEPQPKTGKPKTKKQESPEAQQEVVRAQNKKGVSALPPKTDTKPKPKAEKKSVAEQREEAMEALRDDKKAVSQSKPQTKAQKAAA